MKVTVIVEHQDWKVAQFIAWAATEEAWLGDPFSVLSQDGDSTGELYRHTVVTTEDNTRRVQT